MVSVEDTKTPVVKNNVKEASSLIKKTARKSPLLSTTLPDTGSNARSLFSKLG